MSAVLETRNVSKVYPGSGSGPITAVGGVTIAINAGEFAALVGPSGSGKTTLLAMMAGLLAPTGGSIMIDGREIGSMKEADRVAFRRQQIGFTFQANNLVPYLTALENVELMLRLNNKFDRAGKHRARELLVRLGLEYRLNNLPRQLSGGQQQRVSIARALIHNPAVVLADEPTAALDTERAFQVVETLATLIHEEKRAGIMVTHDMRLAPYVDKVLHMQDGRLAYVVNDKSRLESLDPNATKMTAAGLVSGT